MYGHVIFHFFLSFVLLFSPLGTISLFDIVCLSWLSMYISKISNIIENITFFLCVSLWMYQRRWKLGQYFTFKINEYLCVEKFDFFKFWSAPDKEIYKLNISILITISFAVYWIRFGYDFISLILKIITYLV